MLNLDSCRKVEVKVRHLPHEFVIWDDQPVVATVLMMPNEDNYFVVVGSAPELRLSEAVIRLAIALYPETAVEVRWNFQGSLQGHYQFCK